MPGRDGELVLNQSAELGSERASFDSAAELRGGGTFPIESVPEDLSLYPYDRLVRVLVSADTPRPLAAITGTTFSTLTSGRISYVSTFAGTGQLRLRHGKRTVGYIEAPVAAGEGVFALPTPVPRTNLRLTLTVTATDARVAVARLAVSMAQRLTRPRALRQLRQLEILQVPNVGAIRLRGCRRITAVRFACRAIRIRRVEPGRHRRRCNGLATAVLRPDGVRAYRSGDRRACRAHSSRP
jgi:hypothetical protein